MGRSCVRRMTRQREVILEELRKLRSHPTAVGLFEVVRRRLPRISLGTVYRNLDLLAATGEIQRLDLGGAQARFDGCADRHHHVRCRCCGRVDDVSAEPLDLAAVRREDCSGYELHDCRIEFVGLCPQCREEMATSNKPLKENRSC